MKCFSQSETLNTVLSARLTQGTLWQSKQKHIEKRNGGKHNRNEDARRKPITWTNETCEQVALLIMRKKEMTFYIPSTKKVQLMSFQHRIYKLELFFIGYYL